jgi:hypothetical protein
MSLNTAIAQLDALIAQLRADSEPAVTSNGLPQSGDVVKHNDGICTARIG